MDTLKRFSGLVIIGLSILGLFLCLIGIISVWVVNKPITDSLVEGIQDLDIALKQTNQTLGFVNSGLGSIIEPLKSVSEASSLFQGFLPGFSTGFTDIIEELEKLNVLLVDAQNQITNLLEILAEIQPILPLSLDILSFGSTLLLIWLAFSQVALFIHGWYFFTGQDLLSTLRYPAKTNLQKPRVDYPPRR